MIVQRTKFVVGIEPGILAFKPKNYFLVLFDLLNYIFKHINFKGYLRCKTITSQNVLSEAQIKNFFVS